MLTWRPTQLANKVICLMPWFQPIVMAQWWNVSTKKTVWLGVIAKPLVSALSSSALHPCTKMVDPRFCQVIDWVIGTKHLGHVSEDHWSSAFWWGCSGSWGSIL
jgi:hypothetical protein